MGTMDVFGKEESSTGKIKGQVQIQDRNDTLFKRLCSIENNKVVIYNTIQTLLGTGNFYQGSVEEFKIDEDFQQVIGIRNDVSFLKDDGQMIVLFEAQTQYSKKMPVRMLMYYTRLLELYISKKGGIHNISSTDFVIPKPEFYVLHFNNVKRKETFIEDSFVDKTCNEFLHCKVKNIVLSNNSFRDVKGIVADISDDSVVDIEVYCLFLENFMSIRERRLQEVESLVTNTSMYNSEISNKLFLEIFNETLELIENVLGENIHFSKMYNLLRDSNIRSNIIKEMFAMTREDVLKADAREEGRKEVAVRLLENR